MHFRKKIEVGRPNRYLRPMYSQWESKQKKKNENLNFTFAVVKMYSNWPKRNTKDILWNIWRVLRSTQRPNVEKNIFDQDSPVGLKHDHGV